MKPVWLALCLLAGAAQAADLEAGRQRAAVCEACHGAAAVAANPAVPALAGQQNQFLQWQLVFFRSGRRANPIMGPLSAELTDEEIRNLGAYFASLPPLPARPAAADPVQRAAGQALVAQHRCAACHTDSFAGKQAAPAIARQHRAYLAKALTDYREAARPSTGVAAMNEAAARLSDADIAAIALFLESYE